MALETLKLGPNKDIPIHDPTTMPDIKSEEVGTKNTNSKIEDKLDQLASPKNIELVKIHRTLLPTTSLPTADSKGAEVGNATVQRTQRALIGGTRGRCQD